MVATAARCAISPSSGPTAGDVSLRELPAAELAVAVTHVVEGAIAVSGPIRESYVITTDDVGDESQLVTEIVGRYFPLPTRPPIFRIAQCVRRLERACVSRLHLVENRLPILAC